MHQSIIRLFVEAEIPYWLGGGIAHDALRGYETRPHHDIDLSVLEEDVPRIRTLMESAGFAFDPLRRAGYNAFRKGLHVDLFAWRQLGDYRENVYGRTILRVHVSVFEQFSTVQIENQQVRLIPTDVMHVYAPKVKNKQDRDFIKQQPITSGYYLVTDVQETRLVMDCVRLERIEFDKRPVSEPALLEERRGEA